MITLDKLAAQRDKVLQVYYADALPLEMLKREQSRIDDKVRRAETNLSLACAKLEAGKELIQVALRLLGNCGRAYKKA